MSTALSAPTLSAHHRQHFLDDGWIDSEIAYAMDLGVRSISRDAAAKLLGYIPPSGGIWFPFSDSWGQLRPDTRRYGTGQESPKYCSPRRAIDDRALWLPPGAKIGDLAGVTEGWKDAFIATIRSGKPVGAIAGVSHIYKVLPLSCGVPIVFDSDAWINADVMAHLIRGAHHCGSASAIIPGSPREKRGATEFFASGGTARQFQSLLADADSPVDLLDQWCDRLIADPLSLPKNIGDTAQLYARIGRIADAIGTDAGGHIRRHRQAHRAAWNRQQHQRQVMHLDGAIAGEFEPITPSGNERRLYALNGQKACGKTSIAIRGLMQWALAHKKTMLIYVPTRFLARDTASRFGIYCHMDRSEQARNSPIRVCCPESAHQMDYQHWDIVVSDEVNEVLPRSWEGTLGTAQKQSRDALARQIAGADIVVASQDGLYRPVLRAIQRIGNFAPDQVNVTQRRRSQGGMKIHLYVAQQGTAESRDGIKKNAPRGDWHYHGWLHQLLRAVADGGRVAIPCGSRGQARVLHRLLSTLFPHKHGNCLDGRDSFSSLRKKFAAGPDAWIKKHQPDWLIFTPVFNSGVSIETSYFTHQFEYVAPKETATAASQRGERVRAAIGGGLIAERHVFVQRRGMPSDPPAEIFTAAYWRSLLETAAVGGIKNAQTRLSAWGMGDLSRSLEQATAAPIAEYPELAEVLAIQAREIHYKIECLRDEWDGNGWNIILGTTASPNASCPGDTGLTQSEALTDIRESIIADRAGALALAPTQAVAEGRSESRTRGENDPGDSWEQWKSGCEPRGPIEIAKMTRWATEEILGSIDQMADPQFWAAYKITSPGAIESAQLQMLLRIQWQQPDLWQQIMEWRALRAIARLPEIHIENLPLLPAHPWLLDKAALLGQCPGLRDVIDGTLTQWDKNTPQVQAAHRWAIANAERLAAYTRRSDRWLGLQFKKSTYNVQGFHKLLAAIGIEAHRSGQQGRIHQYRVQRVSDIDRSIERLLADGRDIRSAMRERYRTEHDAAIVDAAYRRATSAATNAIADAWQGVKDSIVQVISPAQNFRGDLNISEVLCPPPEPPDPETWGGLIEWLRSARLYTADAVEGVRLFVTESFGRSTWLDLLAAVPR